MSLVLRWHEARLAEMMKDPAGPVGQLIAELSERGAVVARGTVRVRDPGTRNRHRRAGRGSSAWPPGYAKASIKVHGPVLGSRGGLYGGVNTAYNPGYFLEHPADQMEHRFPFMTTALESLNL